MFFIAGVGRISFGDPDPLIHSFPPYDLAQDTETFGRGSADRRIITTDSTHLLDLLISCSL